MRIAPLLFAAVATIASFTSAEPIKARLASDFVDSIGVCTHWNYLDTPYGRYEELRDLLVDSGIRHIRDGFHVERLPDLAKHGISTCIVAEPELGTPQQIVTKVATMNRQHPGAVDAIEGPNEPDLFWVNNKKSYKGQGAAQGDAGIRRGVVMFQRELYAAAKKNPQTASLLIIGPALGKTYDPINGFFFEKGELATSVDVGNFHPYAGGNPFSPPFPYAGIEKYIWHGTHPTAALDEFPYALKTYGQTFAPKPMATTECGYSTNTNQTSIEAHARYIPRLFAEHFRLGIVRSYVYELVDEWDRPDDREANFGLIKHDLTPKPAYLALKNLIALLNEQIPGKPSVKLPPLEVKTLDIDIKVAPPPGYDRPQYVHHLLLQKRSGEFALLIWHEIALEDSSATPFRQVRHPDMPTTITLPKGVTDLKRFVPNDSADAVPAELNGTTLTLNVPDRVVVLTFKAPAR